MSLLHDLWGPSYILDQVGLLRHLSLSPSSLFTGSLQHQLHGNQIAYTAAQGSQEAWRGEGGEARGGEGSREKGEEKLPITFCDLPSKVMQSHVLYVLLVKAIIKVHPGSRGGLISQCKKSMSEMYVGAAIFGYYNLPYPS